MSTKPKRAKAKRAKAKRTRGRVIAQPKKKEEVDKGGRPRLVCDMNVVEELCRIGATHLEIADSLRISRRSLEYWIADTETRYAVIQRGPRRKVIGVEMLTLQEIMDRGHAGIRISIRRKQLELLNKGDRTMAVWLGKQYLGQTDRTVPAGTPPPDPEEELITDVTLDQVLANKRQILYGKPS